MALSSASQKQSVNLPLLLILIFVPIAGGLWWYLNRAVDNRGPITPPALTQEARSYAANLKLSGVDMKATANYAGAAVVEVTGTVLNSGNRNLNRVELNCVFFDPGGLVVFRERVPIVKSLLRPGEKREFRLPFEGIPGSWNQALPQLVIAHVAFAQ